MTTNETRALVAACLLVAGILVGIMIGRAQVWQEIDAGIAHLRSAPVGVAAVMQGDAERGSVL